MSRHGKGSSLLSAVEDGTRGRAPVAPWWHTLLLVIFIMGASWSTSVAVRSGTATETSRISRYIETVVMQYLVVLYVWWGLRQRATKLGEIIGRTWHSFEDVLLDVAIAAGFWAAAMLVLVGLQYALGLAQQHNVKARLHDLSFIAPQTPRELAVFLLVAVTAAICEEIIFRGYLQRQLIAYSRSTAVGIVLTGALFGLAHGYQGWRLMIVLSVFGILFGMLAHFRRSILPGMLAHGAQDAFAGTAMYLLKYLPLK